MKPLVRGVTSACKPLEVAEASVIKGAKLCSTWGDVECGVENANKSDMPATSLAKRDFCKTVLLIKFKAKQTHRVWVHLHAYKGLTIASKPRRTLVLYHRKHFAYQWHFACFLRFYGKHVSNSYHKSSKPGYQDSDPFSLLLPFFCCCCTVTSLREETREFIMAYILII